MEMTTFRGHNEDMLQGAGNSVGWGGFGRRFFVSQVLNTCRNLCASES